MPSMQINKCLELLLELALRDKEFLDVVIECQGLKILLSIGEAYSTFISYLGFGFSHNFLMISLNIFFIS